MGFFGDLFGGQQKKAGKQAQQQALQQTQQVGQQGGQVAKESAQMGRGYDVGTQQSMGANAAEMMQKAQGAASGLAEQQGRTAATQGSRAALQAARTSGVNPGQAALAGAQQAGDLYTGAYGGGLERGMERYGKNVEQFAGQGAEMAGRRMGGLGLQGQMAGQAAGQGGQMYEQGKQKGQALMQGIGKVAGAVGGMLSDERAKDIQGKPDIAAILEKIDPVRFAYKAEPGVERVGVTAQDVEASPLKAAVIQTPAGKALDTDALAGSNLAMLVELGKRLTSLERRLKGKANG